MGKVSLLPNKLVRWLRDGNNCGKCPCLWSECDYWGDYDEGCTAGRYYKDVCRLPRSVRWYKNRRNKYFVNHEYDWCGKWYIAHEEKVIACEKAISERLSIYGIHVICWKDDDGQYHEVDQEAYIRDMACEAESTISDYNYQHEPHGLKTEWSVLIRKTADRWLFMLKSLFLVG